MTWLGLKTLAFIPLSRTDAQPPDIIPPDWIDQIWQRVFFDPAKDPKTGQPIPGTDRSVRAYIHTVSSGLADLDVVVQLPQTIEGQDIQPWALKRFQDEEVQLRANGFDGAAVAMLGGPGGGSTSGYWSRFCMSDNLGNWVGEVVHQTTYAIFPICLILPISIRTRTWVPLTRRLAMPPLISRPGRNGRSDGSILRLFSCTLGAWLTTPCTQSASFNRPQPEE